MSLSKCLGFVEWKSPSNIALVKYWGKHGTQLPKNPSVSFTLSKSSTLTKLGWARRLDNTNFQKKVNLDFNFEGSNNANFSKRIERFLESTIKDYPIFGEYDLTVESSNSFPHSAGIASSASSLSALSLCLCSMDCFLASKSRVRDEKFFKKVSHLARLGSGSASRSVYGGVVAWGQSEVLSDTSDYHAIALNDVDRVFMDYQDSILITDSTPKSVSSGQGHALMKDHPFSQARYLQANVNFKKIIKALAQGDLSTFIEVVELEALTLHSLMMTSTPSYMLLNQSTVEIIEKVRLFRKETSIPVCFTLDAGPNVHLLYPKVHKKRVESFIKAKLQTHLQNGQYIVDEVGDGPSLIKGPGYGQ